MTVVGYFLMVCCLAEMSSALPFSGGIYGVARVSLGSYFGYICGILELFLNFCYLVINIVALSQVLPIAGIGDFELSPLYSFIIWFSLVIVLIIGRSFFWGVNDVLAIMAIIVQLIFIFGGSANANFTKWTDYQSTITSKNFMYALPNAGIIISAIQYQILASSRCTDPSKQMPYILLITFTILVLAGISTILVGGSHAPGPAELGNYLFPLVAVFSKLFNISEGQATLFMIPTGYGTSVTLLWALGKQTVSISKSGYFPSIFQWKSSFSSTPYVAYSVAGIIGFFFCYAAYEKDIVYFEMGNVTAITSYLIFILAMSSYIAFKRQYSSLSRHFTSPFGIIGAIIGIGIFSFFIINNIILGIWANDPNFFYILLIILVPANIIYFGFIVKNLQFSEEEKKQLFKAYIMNANAAKRKKMKKGQIIPSSGMIGSKSNLSNNSQECRSGQRASSISRGDSMSQDVEGAPSPGIIVTRNPELVNTPSDQSHLSTWTSFGRLLGTKHNSVVPQLEQRIEEGPPGQEQEEEDHEMEEDFTPTKEFSNLHSPESFPHGNLFPQSPALGINQDISAH